MRARHVVGAAQLQDLDLANGGQLVARVREADDAVGDGELRVARDFAFGVFADQQARRSPAGGMHREVGTRTCVRRAGSPRMSRMALKLSITTTAGASRSTRAAISLSVASAPLRRITEPRSANTIVLSSKLSSKNENCCMYCSSFKEGSASVVKYRHFLPCRANANSSCSENNVLPAPGCRQRRSPSERGCRHPGCDRTPRCRWSAAPRRGAGRSRACPPRWNDAVLAQLRDLAQAIHHDRSGQLDQEGPQLGDQRAQGRKRLRAAVVPGVRNLVLVLEGCARDLELEQLRNFYRGALGGASQQGGPRPRCRAGRPARARAARTARPPTTYSGRRSCRCRPSLHGSLRYSEMKEPTALWRGGCSPIARIVHYGCLTDDTGRAAAGRRRGGDAASPPASTPHWGVLAWRARGSTPAAGRPAVAPEDRSPLQRPRAGVRTILQSHGGETSCGRFRGFELQ